MIMDHAAMQDFSMGPWTLVLAFVTSFVGSLIGLSCMARARRERRRRHAVLWTACGAVAIGGVAIWLAHFIAMLGFAVADSQVRYSAWLTALSAMVAILVVGVGLSIVTLRRFTVPRLVCAGAVAGVGIAFMHYLGMAAIRFQGDISYAPLPVLLSVVIAVVAATAAFWFTVVVKATPARLAAGLVMAGAVAGVHYTGMAAVSVTMVPSQPASLDTDAFDLVFPVFVTSGLVIAALLWALFTSVGPELSRGQQHAEPGALAGRAH
jgi:NO-binding membrane sensor protein with MHYT domain